MRKLPVLILGAAVTFLTGCYADFGDSSERFQKDFRYTYPLKSGGTFVLENMNGSVEITGWDREEAEITGVKYARTQALCDAVRIEITHSDAAVSVRTVRPFENNGNMGARYLIHLPRKVILDRVTSSNGKIRVEQIDGAARLKTSNGSVNVTKLAGNVEAQSTNGAVEVEDVQGSAHLHTTNGHIQAEGIKESVDASSTNGGIELKMSSGVNGELHATTTNGGITVQLPATVAARLNAYTSNSSISSAFEVGAQGRIEKHHLEGNLNGASGSSPLIDLHTTNGSIHVEKL
ncbi:MAG: DUF4097 family beta strand repeat-containing protein [Acidobacteriota bacterium]|nr:DUF4097 family beta strand repeat-containing protein [Acidobacteriota bacterium]